MCLVESYYKLSGTLRKLQRNWFARPINSFSSWTVDELQYWLRTAKRILTKNKLIPSPKLQELKNYTILADKNNNSESAYLDHKILPVQPLHNYKNTSITRFFSSAAASTDQQNLFPGCTSNTKTNFHKSSPDSLSTFSTMTPQSSSGTHLHIFTKLLQIILFVCTMYLKLFFYLFK